jgi:hypothetical protein
MKRNDGPLDNGGRRPGYPSLLDLALRTGRWTLAAGGAAAVIATGGAGCGAADGPVTYETAGIVADIALGTDDAAPVPDEGSMSEQVLPGKDVGALPDLPLDVEDAVAVPDLPPVPDATDEGFVFEVAGVPDIFAILDAADEVAPEAIDDTVLPIELASDMDDAPGE